MLDIFRTYVPNPNVGSLVLSLKSISTSLCFFLYAIDLRRSSAKTERADLTSDWPVPTNVDR
jgi:hypothetical protein